MYDPRRSRGPAVVCNRMPRIGSMVTAGVLALGVVFGPVAAASADPLPTQGPRVTVDIVGDSYAAGEGVQTTYIDAGDQRHRSLVSPALLALSRVADGNPGMRVDANVVASSGAVVSDFFMPQKTQDGQAVINDPQVDQIRPSAQLVIVEFGGNDALLAQVLAEARRSGASLDATVKKLVGLLVSDGTPEEYFAQARSSTPGQAPTLVARMLQVLAGVANRAPHARIVVTNYPLAVDPQNKHSSSLISERDLTTVRKFQHDLNKAIGRAVEICGCADLLDVSGAVAGHEAYTTDTAFNERSDQQSPREMYYPNRKGASLIANPIAAGLARLLGVKAPNPSEDMTVPANIMTRSGVSDRDGDQVPDVKDKAPNDPARSEDRKPVDRKANSPAAPREQPARPVDARSKSGRGSRGPLPVVTKAATKVVTKVVAKSVPSSGPKPGQDHDGQRPSQAPATATPATATPAATTPGTATPGTNPAGTGTRPAKPNDEKDSTGFTAPPTSKSEVVTKPARKHVTGQEASERKPAARSVEDTDRKPVWDKETGSLRNSGKVARWIRSTENADGADAQADEKDAADQEEVNS
jgi:lysophospholipase L1-like esterase